MDANLDKIREKYVRDADAMAAKPRFGYFSIPPSHTAGITEFAAKTVIKDQNGKVKTEDRNIFSGTISSGTMKKSFFSYVPSVFHGDKFEDPGKVQRKRELSESKKWQAKEIFHPAKLNKTLVAAPYKYIEQREKENSKNHRDADGKVITANPNISCSLLSKIEHNKNKQFKYTPDPYDRIKKLKRDEIQKETKLRREEAFKSGNPIKPFFSNNIEAFCDTNMAANKKKKQFQGKRAAHQGPFRSTCMTPNSFFNRIVYKEEGTDKPKTAKVESRAQAKNDAFKLLKVEYNSKPCPSISCSKMNLIKYCR